MAGMATNCKRGIDSSVAVTISLPKNRYRRIDKIINWNKKSKINKQWHTILNDFSQCQYSANEWRIPHGWHHISLHNHNRICVCKRVIPALAEPHSKRFPQWKNVASTLFTSQTIDNRHHLGERKTSTGNRQLLDVIQRTNADA